MRTRTKHLLLATAAYAALMTAACLDTPEPSYVWYPAASVDSLRAILNRSGPSILKEQHDTLWVLPVADGAARLMADSNPPVDDSHRCPPQCP